MNSNTSTPRSSSSLVRDEKKQKERLERTLNRKISPPVSESIETSEFSSESDDGNNNSNRNRLHRKKNKLKSPRTNNNINNNSNKSSMLLWKTENNQGLIPPVAMAKDIEAKNKKKRRNLCIRILLIIIILFLLGNIIALDVIVFRSSMPKTKDTPNLQYQDEKPTMCSTLLGATNPKEFSCSTCSDEQSFYNVSTFCVLQNIWANSFDQASLENNLKWMQDSNFCDWGGIKCDNSKNIIALDLKSPNFPKTLSNDLGNLKTLQRLSIIGNGLLPNNDIPPSIFKLENLVELSLVSTGLSGSIPDTFDKMTSLKSLNIANNAQLKNPNIPNTILKTSLTTLIYNNQSISGLIPDFSGTIQSSLENLDLSSNQFAGNLPDSLMSLSKLKSLKLSRNYLNGILPQSFVTSKFAKSLVSLDLSVNTFSGPISDLSQYENLENLILSNNAFTGPFPNSIGTMTKLKVLLLGNNKLTGVIPANICEKDSFQECNMSQSGLTSPKTCVKCRL